jgi:hypothetical protein
MPGSHKSTVVLLDFFNGASKLKNNASTAIKRFASGINQQRHHSKNEGISGSGKMARNIRNDS